MLRKIHNIFAMISFFTIVIFWFSTIIVELLFGYELITLVKSLIVFPGLFILIPSIITTAITGNILAKSSKNIELIKVKKRRMPFIAIIGALVLVPCAIYLNHLASNNIFDSTFYIVQFIEVLGGIINISLMFLNIRDSKMK